MLVRTIRTTRDVVRLAGGLVRVADGRLARTAALNAARSVVDDHGRHLDEARALRDLARLPVTAGARRRATLPTG